MINSCDKITYINFLPGLSAYIHMTPPVTPLPHLLPLSSAMLSSLVEITNFNEFDKFISVFLPSSHSRLISPERKKRKKIAKDRHFR